MGTRKTTRATKGKRDQKNEINELKRAFVYNLFYNQGKPLENATMHDYYMAVAHTVRDRMQHLFINSVEGLIEAPSKIVCYLSAEFLLGPHLHNNLVCLGLYDQVAKALEETGLDIREIIDQEVEPGLGNGGLGRLAACYMDSLATGQIPAIGYGIRYEHGMFHQVIEDGWQKELSDMWLHYGNPLEIKKPDICHGIGFGGHTESYTDEAGRMRMRWLPARMVNAVAYDTPIPGYRVNNVNLLRLWSAEAVDSFDFEEFNVGDYFGAIEEKIKAENISKVLYPNDEQCAGKQLRLEQQFFFVSASLQDMIRMHLMKNDTLDTLPERFAAQLNDTHPAVAVPELMRLLMDEHGYGWDQAWTAL
jgi:starch phosphorylase